MVPVSHRTGDRPDGPPEEPVVRDKRRIDPVTGAVRPDVATSAAESAPPAPPVGADRAGELEVQLAERTADLQRIKAEYDNYRRRVERDRLAVAEQALANVLLGILPVLDDVERARSHGELQGGFKSVGDNLVTSVTKLGLQAFGEPGEPFDPTVHEALTHSYAEDVTEPTCSEVFQSGYRLGQRVLRPARVAVVEPRPQPVGDGAAGDDAAGPTAGGDGTDTAPTGA